MNKKKDKNLSWQSSFKGIFGGFTEILEKLEDLAEKGESLSRSGEFQWQGSDNKDNKDMKGVYGFTVKTGLGDQGVKVEPFGNIRKDETTGKSVVQEIREPMVDIFEEPDCTLIVAEMPGISEGDVTLNVEDDLMSLYAERGEKKYSKEILLPRSYSKENVALSCNNGMLEIRCSNSSSS